jgi:hypothetical protein
MGVRYRRYPDLSAQIGQGLKSHPQPTFGCGDCAEIKNFAQRESLSKTRVFERDRVSGKFRNKNSLNASQNSFLISASQKARVRLSFERGHDDQTDKDR